MITFIIDFDYKFLFIEEPESHLHPEMQKKLLNFIRSVKSKQFIFSTHANTFLNANMVDRIFYLEFDTNVKIIDETSISKMLYNLGYSVVDNLVNDAVVLTEGPRDIPVILKIFEWLGVDNKYKISFWPLGGDIMASLDLSVFSERNNVFALVDNDPGSSAARTRFLRNCKNFNILCHKLNRYSLENYFTLDAIKECFQDKELEKITILKPDEKVDKQIGFFSKGKTIKIKNDKIINKMTLEDIRETDLYDFCLEIKENLKDKK